MPLTSVTFVAGCANLNNGGTDRGSFFLRLSNTGTSPNVWCGVNLGGGRRPRHGFVLS
uniref:Uncharacterized protein n=1 Tax=Arundo donax TaxID=35708 RepID=A0A0A9AT11_ARUDO